MRKLILLLSLTAFIGLSAFESTNGKVEPVKASIVVSENLSVDQTSFYQTPEFVNVTESVNVGNLPFTTFNTRLCKYDPNGVYYCCYYDGGRVVCRKENP